MALKILRSIRELPERGFPEAGFVPTMGAFHEGHLSLMRTAKRETGTCVVSLFVNPTQFLQGEDYERYPRREAEDFEMAHRAGVDVIFVPRTEDMYRDSRTKVCINGIRSMWEGELRPGHFEGVATIVAKLFNLVRPKAAYFGLKDYQQCIVIESMVRDLNFPIELRFLETIREGSGLAMSSRNQYLTLEQQQAAAHLYETLQWAARQIQMGEIVQKIEDESTRRLGSVGFEVQYFACVDAKSLERAPQNGGPRRLIAAAKLGQTRLIDNIAV